MTAPELYIAKDGYNYFHLEIVEPKTAMGQGAWIAPPLRLYIAATLRKILEQHMQSDVDELMPRNFAE